MMPSEQEGLAALHQPGTARVQAFADADSTESLWNSKLLKASRPRDASSQPKSWFLGFLLLLIAAPAWLSCAPGGIAFAADPAGSSPDFTSVIRPLLQQYCLACHSTEKHKGDLDLERFSSHDLAKRFPKIWQGVAEQLASQEMPPKDKPQPSAEQRDQLLAWANALLDEIAQARAGDPGPVVLRRLSNAEYTYTIRDLTGVESLDPAREFPTDSASGEGFMNVGHSLVMSPSLVTKYLDAGKEIARHAVLLPDGIRFSSKNTRRDWTEEILAEIRGFYRRYTETGGGSAVNLQGIQFDTKDGGILPLEKYLAVTLEAGSDRSTVPTASRLESLSFARGLSPRYLTLLWDALTSSKPSVLLDPLRTRWRAARPGDASILAQEIAPWQHALWKFNSVGHIGKLNGPKAWMEPILPLQSRQEIRLKLSPPRDGRDITVYLVASDAGDGSDGDDVVWERPRLEAPGRPTLLLRNVREGYRVLSARRERLLATTSQCLQAAAEATEASGRWDVAELARRHGVEADILSSWLDYLGVGAGGPVQIVGHFTNQYTSASGYDFIKGWGKGETPNLAANSSDQHVRIPGNMKPHSVAVHPSPKLAAVVGWRSPVAGHVRVAAAIQHAHPECGNGVTWSLELRRGATRQRLAAGTAQGAKEVRPAPVENLPVHPGDLVSLLIGPRDGNDSCDLTAIDLSLTEVRDAGREWDLAIDVSPDILAGNPQADRFGNADVWHFYTEPVDAGPVGPVVPAGSVLARWRALPNTDEKRKLAHDVQQLLVAGPLAGPDSPDAVLYRQLASLSGPLFKHQINSSRPQDTTGATPNAKSEISPNQNAIASSSPGDTGAGLDPGLFGRHPNGSSLDPASLCVRAPSQLEIRLPSDWLAGYELVTTGSLHAGTGREGSVQIQALITKPQSNRGLVASPASAPGGKGTWTDADKPLVFATPILVNDGSAARRRLEAALDEFRQIFPAALCYTKIVPVDEVVTLTLSYREDHHFARLMLAPSETARLGQLWDELHYVSHDALTLVDAFEQLWQYATQDADPKVFEPMREPIQRQAAAFRRRLVETQPRHLDAVLQFADGAYRRPLAGEEKEELRGLYRKLRDQELPHDDAVRLTLARVLIAPAFLYRAERPGPGAEPGPVNDWELATRLSYFLWAAAPDAELRQLAQGGKLHDPEVLAAQSRRMLRDARARRLAKEFACAWLHTYDFDQLGEKSERHFPTFTALRGAMYEESIRFFTDFFQRDGSVLEILDADHTFLNEELARHYGIPGVTGAEWRRVDGVGQYSRGGILAQATTLAKQSGASRTSPILRGNWVAEVLLGEKLPRPPKDVPRLPEDEATESLSVRQLVEKHSSDPKCYGCHRRIDPYGFSLEGFDAIGRRRERDLGDRSVDTRVKAMDGAEFEGLPGLRAYLLHQRRDAFLRQFCRKLLGYSLGRGVLLSDGPLISEMRSQLKSHDNRITAAIETIVRSRQFREVRGQDAPNDE